MNVSGPTGRSANLDVPAGAALARRRSLETGLVAPTVAGRARGTGVVGARNDRRWLRQDVRGNDGVGDRTGADRVTRIRGERLVETDVDDAGVVLRRRAGNEDVLRTGRRIDAVLPRDRVA